MLGYNIVVGGWAGAFDFVLVSLLVFGFCLDVALSVLSVVNWLTSSEKDSFQNPSKNFL